MNFKIILLSIFIIATTIISEGNVTEETLTKEGKGKEIPETFEEKPGNNPPGELAPMLNCNMIFKDSSDAIKIIKLLRGGKGRVKLDYKAELQSENDTAFTSKSIALEMSTKILIFSTFISLAIFLIN